MTSRRHLEVVPDISRPELSPAHKRFNTLLRQIGKAKETLAAWQANVPGFREAHHQLLQPLLDELAAGDKQWLLALESAIGQRGWTPGEKRKLVEFFCDRCHAFLEIVMDDTLKALHDKHAEVGFDEGQRKMLLAAKNIAECIHGLDLGDDHDTATNEELIERLRQAYGDLDKDREAAGHAGDESPEPARKIATQKRQEAAAKEAAQSLREVYRKLASALHPDRTSEDMHSAEKTALMQRVNQAYSAKDLLSLLQLQLEIEQIDDSHIANASAERLKHYNKVITEQLEELKAEVQRTQWGFLTEFNLGFRNVDPRQLGKLIEAKKRAYQADLAEQQLHIRMLEDKAATKRWLKRMKPPVAMPDLDFIPMEHWR